MPKFHTSPESVSIQLCLDDKHNAFHCAIVRSANGLILAMYPAKWNNNLSPSMKTLRKDFQWQAPKGSVYPILERGPNIEVGSCRRGRPGYRWVPGWVVRYSADRVSMPMRYGEARNLFAESKGAGA